MYNNIKSETEAQDLAKLELESLFGNIEPIFNFADKLCEEPLRKFMNLPERVQDYITYELPYGRIQGYFAKSDEAKDLGKLVKRLAYTREIYLIVNSNESPSKLLKLIFPEGVLDKNIQFFKAENYICFRAITHQYFLEKSEYITKLSRNEQEIERNVEILFSYLTNERYRIPAPSTLSIGKKLQDYFAIREEPSLYLTHYFHPYKGKFHPKMVRALLNYIYPYDKGIVLDNFAGSGTLLVEATLLGLDSKGIEINPLSVLMSNVKCKSFLIEPAQLKEEINNYFEKVKDSILTYQSMKKGQLPIYPKRNIDFDKIKQKSTILSAKLKNYLRNNDEIVPQVLICKELLSEVMDETVKEFLLALSGAISDVVRRTSEQFLEVYQSRVKDLYLRLFLFRKLNEVLKIKLGKSKTYVGDARNMENFIEAEEIDGIVNSPPYSIALDYIKNDFPQLVLLELTESLDKLNEDMIGNPRVNYDRKVLINHIKKENENNPLNISKTAREIINTLLTNGRKQLALRSFKFFTDMLQSLKDMYRVMKKGAKCAIVIGNNHFMVNNYFVEVPNDKVILELARKIGFIECQFTERELQKSSEGNIRKESIIILQKEEI
ncbi:MAG: DNA methyltransferase [Deltaproteobacteria bacterium]|nr:DNA methyltransferase [Deltaproteobacteria bacterium]